MLLLELKYALEYESYKHLPKILKEKYEIELKERIVRADVGGEEIDIFCWAEKEGKKILVIGEGRLELEDNPDGSEPEIFRDWKYRVEAVMDKYGPVEFVIVWVTHCASPEFLEMAKEKGIIVVQSFEW